jgi:negative regulator of replication initiation
MPPSLPDPPARDKRPRILADEHVDDDLYDYVADPGETANIAATQPDVVARLRAFLARHPAAKPQATADSP